MKSDTPAFWKSPSFIGACVGAVVAIALDLALATPKSGGADFVRFVGRFHPLVVHLPIGFLILVGFAEALTLIPKMRARVDPALGLLLPPLLASAVGAFMLGLLLARDGGYPTKLVALHRNFTLGAVVGMAACLAAWSAQGVEKNGPARAAYRAVLGLTLALVTVGAHFGGSITRGESYLTRYAPPFAQRWLGGAPKEPPAEAPPAADASSDPLVYRDVVAPILKARCAECHGDSTMKASLRLDSLEAIRKGGENGPVVVEGQGATSSLVKRMLLPLDQDEHMPPEGKPGPTADEIEAIRFWIDRGATDTLRVRDALASDSARSVLAKAVSSAAMAPSASPPASAAPPTSSGTSEPTAAPGSVATPPSTGPSNAARSGVAWDDAIEPLLVSRCGKCHGAEKQKGKLRVDSIGALLSGGKAGPAVVAGSTSSGTLLARIQLPVESEDHMPPKKEAQLDPSEIELLSYWIQHGASTELKTASIPAPLLVRSTPAPTATAHPAESASSEPAPSSPPPNPAIDPKSLPADVKLYADVVKPILETRCGLCHSGESPSGDLDIGDHAKLLKSSAIVPGKAARSTLVQRAALPLRDSDHMPPEGQDQPERGEIDALKLWIAKGASEDLVVPASSLSPDVAYAAAAMLAKAQSGVPGPGPAASAEPSATASAASSTAVVAPAPPSATASPVAPGPPSLGPQSGCAACAVSADDSPFWLASVAALAGLVLLVTRRARRLDDSD